MLIGLQGVTRSFGLHDVLKGVDWQIHEGERWALVGPNGSGKTTLLKILNGKETADEGEVIRHRNVRLATLPQTDLAEGKETALDYLLESYGHVVERERELEGLHRRVAEGEYDPGTMERIAHLQEWLHHNEGYTYEARVNAALQGLGFGRGDGGRPCGSFSGGEQMRLKIGRAVLDPADLILLDEPGNHLDAVQRQWLGKYLQECGRAFIVVTHDPEILEGAVDHIAYLVDGKVYTFRGDFQAFLVQFEEMKKSREKAFAKQQNFISRTEAFVRRYKAGQRSKQARGREKVLQRLERLDAPVGDLKTQYRLSLAFDEMTGEDVLEARGLAMTMGERTLRVPSLHLRRGGKVALMGPNGSGKTTLLKTLAREIPPSAGSVRWGTHVCLAHFDQHQTAIPGTLSLFDAIAARMPGEPRERVMDHLGAFGFGGNRAVQKAGSLSGGEKARLNLLAVLLARANVLFLDEPTNHLDENSLAVLFDALRSFKGTAVLVSHDVSFLEALADQTWIIRGDMVESVPDFSPEWAKFEEKGRGSRKAAEKRSHEKKSEGLSKNERFRLERLLEETEGRSAELEVEKGEIEEKFARPDELPAEEWQALNRRYEEVKGEIADLEERWLEISEKLESDQK